MADEDFNEEEGDDVIKGCPPEGFHKQDQEGSAMAYGEDDPKVIPDRIQFLRRVLEHVRHFISMVACPQWQLASLSIVADAVQIIQLEKYVTF